MKTSEILKDLRKSKKMTQADLAKALKIGQATVAGYENEEYIPHISSLIAYANFFECSIDYLVGREDDFGNITIKAENAAPALTEQERRMLELYRKLPPYLQENAYAELKGMAIAVESAKKEKKL